MTDKSEPTKQELEQRVEQLEEYVSKMMPSRRDVLKAGGGGLLGGAAVLSATNSAAAADDSPDALGAAGDSMDVYLDQIRRPDGSGVVGDLDPSGTFDWSIGHSMPSVDTDDLDISGKNFVEANDKLGVISVANPTDIASTTSNSYQTVLINRWRIKWNSFFPANASAVWTLNYRVDTNDDQLDTRIQNLSDGETVLEDTGETGIGNRTLQATYTPTTKSNQIIFALEIRNSDGASTVAIGNPSVVVGVQL